MQFHVSTGLNLTIAPSVDTVITLISQAKKPGPREVESPAKVAQLRSSSLSVDFDFLFSACGGGAGRQLRRKLPGN